MVGKVKLTIAGPLETVRGMKRLCSLHNVTLRIVHTDDDNWLAKARLYNTARLVEWEEEAFSDCLEDALVKLEERVEARVQCK